jgi:hypothetical protein
VLPKKNVNWKLLIAVLNSSFVAVSAELAGRIEPFALLGMGFDFSAGVSWERGVPRSGQRLGLAIEGPEEIFCFFTPPPP